VITCVPVMGCATAAALVKMEEAFKVADMVELRLDRMVDPDLARLLMKGPDRIVATNRRKEEGGGFRGTEGDRVDLLREASRSGSATWTSRPHRSRSGRPVTIGHCRRGHRTRLIVSSHDFSGTPALTGSEKRMEACTEGDIAKIVPMQACRGQSAHSPSSSPMRIERTEGSSPSAWGIWDG